MMSNSITRGSYWSWLLKLIILVLQRSLHSPSVVVEQATQQLSPAWTLMRGGTPGCPEIPDWLATNLPDAARVGIDPYLHTVRLCRGTYIYCHI